MKKTTILFRKLRKMAELESREDVASFLFKHENTIGHQENINSKMYKEWLLERAARLRMEEKLRDFAEEIEEEEKETSFKLKEIARTRKEISEILNKSS